MSFVGVQNQDLTTIGSKRYMSPEMWEAFNSNTPFKNDIYRSDVYSLGLVLLLMCKPSLIRCTTLDLRDVIPRELSILRKTSDYGEALLDLITEMLNVENQKRPDFLELAKRLGIPNVL